MTWALSGVRLRALTDRTAKNAKIQDVAHWIETGELRDDTKPPVEADPAVLVAREQIKKDGRLIVENVAKVIEQWQQDRTSKPEKPT